MKLHFLKGLFWVAFLFLGLYRLQGASGKVIGRHRKSIASCKVEEQLFLSSDSKFMGKVIEENRYAINSHFEDATLMQD